MMRKEKKILVAGFEIGGQMQLLVETMRSRWFKASSAAFNDDYRGYQNDIMIHGKGFRHFLNRVLFFLWACINYDVFHFFWGQSLLSVWRLHLVDLPILRLLGKKIIVHFRGLDVVDIQYFDHCRAIARGEESIAPSMSRPDQLKKIKKWVKYADYVLVSEPDLHFVSDKSVLSPQVINLSYWKTAVRPLSEKDGIVRVVHAPSSRRKKGTDFIENAVDQLKKRGYKIELILAEKLPYHRIKELYEIADIGIDQVLYGWHGKVSVELMALGKPVICNISPEFRKYRTDLPIIHGDPTNLETALIDLIENKYKREELGIEGKEYVAKYHDVEKVVGNLLELYDMGQNTRKKEEVRDAKTW